ncbi:MAG TPA: hypothetical protein VNI78_10310 [Vicinamibacterales bacterium]|nr:hypothetical protein [Vicinamibacterales bacterium]
MLRTFASLAAAALVVTPAAGSLHARQRGAAQPPAPVLLLELALRNEARVPLTQQAITTPNADLQRYGDGRNIIVATGSGPELPRLFFGLCTGPCGFTLKERGNYLDLTGRAKVRFTTIVSGFHRVRPIVKIADGTLLICDQAQGSTADWHRYDISFADCRWLRLHPARGVTLGATWVPADLSRVDEVGLFDILPGSGEWTLPGQPVEKQPPPPAGGWIAISTFEVWGQRVPRQAAR